MVGLNTKARRLEGHKEQHVSGDSIGRQIFCFFLFDFASAGLPIGAVKEKALCVL
jgi:hypothetical protein